VLVAWWIVAGLIGFVVVMETFGVITAGRNGRGGYSFASPIALPPLAGLLGIISLVGRGDLWVFNPALGTALVVSALLLVGLVAVLVRRSLRLGDEPE
jgi:hypothetical protein